MLTIYSLVPGHSPCFQCCTQENMRVAQKRGYIYIYYIYYSNVNLLQQYQTYMYSQYHNYYCPHHVFTFTYSLWLAIITTVVGSLLYFIRNVTRANFNWSDFQNSIIYSVKYAQSQKECTYKFNMPNMYYFIGMLELAPY